MGFNYETLFFYGIFLEPGFKEYVPEKFLKEIEGMRPQKGDLKETGLSLTEFYEDSEFECNGIEVLDKFWEHKDDPVCIGRPIGYGIHEASPYLGIRVSRHRTSNRNYPNLVEFDLPINGKELWDHLFKEKCSRYGIEWRAPHFNLLTMGEHQLGTFFYGLLFCGDELSKTSFGEVTPDKIDRLNNEWKSAGNPLFFYWLVAEMDIFYLLGVRGTLEDTNSHTEFKLETFDPAAWDCLLKAKCETYGIAWRDPAFHLILEIH